MDAFRMTEMRGTAFRRELNQFMMDHDANRDSLLDLDEFKRAMLNFSFKSDDIAVNDSNDTEE
jgi:hypothetical protein